ncbi:hypothetical protein MPSEU_000213800 [Mayamaea pseudoterrestris]|nr:hypothetical protein MPSEU_000213800 [Mayamaea pseudoterrestris]
MAAMAIDDELYELVHSDDDEMMLGDWCDEDMTEDNGMHVAQGLPTASFSSTDEILMDFCDLPSLDLLGYNEHGDLLPGLAYSSSSSTSSSDDSIDEDLTGSFFDRLQVTSRKLRESMKKSQATRNSLVLKTERTAEYAERVEQVVKLVKESTDKLQVIMI